METNFKTGFLAGYQFLQFSEGNISLKICEKMKGHQQDSTCEACVHNFARHWRKMFAFFWQIMGKIQIGTQKNCVPHVIRKFYFRSGLTTVRDWLSSLFSKELGRLKTTPAYIAK